ncbi:MAG: hypothetical protein F4X77_03965, partial [Acidobacteriia bacterium]|nr:hypothetical protein [Terriglobia bacterium]
MPRPVETLQILPAEQQELERRVRAATASRRDADGARIVLLRVRGVREKDLAAKLGVSIGSVNRTSERFDVD